MSAISRICWFKDKGERCHFLSSSVVVVGSVLLRSLEADCRVTFQGPPSEDLDGRRHWLLDVKLCHIKSKAVEEDAQSVVGKTVICCGA